MPDDNLHALFGETPPEPPAPTPEPEPPATETPAEPAPAVEPDEEPPEARPGERAVPLSALQKVRTERQDWKEQFTRRDEQAKTFEAEARTARERAEAAEARIAELQRAPQPAVVQPPPALPNVLEDPAGYHSALRAQSQQDMWDMKLDMSEQIYAQANPGVDTKAIAAKFLEAAKADPSLGAKLRAAPHPYAFAAQHLKRAEALAKVGDDPDAWIQAEVERRLAEQAAAAPAPLQPAPAAPSPARRQQPALPASLATARSAAPGAEAAPSGDQMFADAFPKR